MRSRREGDLLVDSVVHQQLSDDGGQEGRGDAQAEAAAGAVERPPQAQGQRRQRQGQLHIVCKVQLL